MSRDILQLRRKKPEHDRHLSQGQPDAPATSRRGILLPLQRMGTRGHFWNGDQRMLKHQQKIAPILSFVLLVTVLSWQVQVASIQQDNAHLGNRPGQSAIKKTSPKTTDERIAHYTELLAWFTAVLALVSFGQGWFLYRADKTARTTADAAQKSAIAAIGVELPRFILKDVRMISLEKAPRLALETGALYIEFVNHGRTDAVITSECFDWRVSLVLPPRPQYEQSSLAKADLGAVVEPKAEYQMSSPRGGLRITGRPISSDEITRVLRGDDRLWVYGYISYQDFLYTAHTTGFCIRLDVLHARFSGTNKIDRDTIVRFQFVRDGPPTYSYQT
jgi:hypothetical protein